MRRFLDRFDNHVEFCDSVDAKQLNNLDRATNCISGAICACHTFGWVPLVPADVQCEGHNCWPDSLDVLRRSALNKLEREMTGQLSLLNFQGCLLRLMNTIYC